MESQNVWQIFDSLPAKAKQEAIDFITFLQKRYEKSEEIKSKKGKFTDEVFVGMWEKHDGFADSTGWVRDIRKNEWK